MRARISRCLIVVLLLVVQIAACARYPSKSTEPQL